MKKIDLGVVVTTLIIVTISCSLAFFAARVIGNPKDINLVAKNVAITFTDTSNIASDVISPGWNNVKTFTITNNSKEDFSYNIILKGLVNTFESINTLQYKITSDNGYNMDNYLNVIKTETSKDVVLAYNITIPKNTKQSYQVEFNYVSTEEDQSADMGKKLGGTLAIEESTGTPEIYDKLLADNPTIKTRTDFSTTLTETNVNTLYKSQEDNTDVYYFAGDARNNWVKFGGYYWRIIRTNSDGSIRLLYHGTSTTATDAYIENSKYNESSSDPMYVGYMYGTSGSLENNRLNTNSSNIKKVIDEWYENNLFGYTKYISKTAVYCNDRSVGEGTYNMSKTEFHYAPYARVITNKVPSFNCTANEDKFTVDGSYGNGDLTYPIALMTADELAYAGGVWQMKANVYYELNNSGTSSVNNIFWLTMSPDLSANSSYIFGTSGGGGVGYIGHNYLDSARYVRPVISIKGDNIWKNGDGSAEHPYEIEDFTSLTDKVLSDNPTIKTRTDFSSVFTETNTGTLYKATESIAGSTPKDVYYFAGNALNNWVKFGTWREDKSIVLGYRSTDSGDYSKRFTSLSECNNDKVFHFNCEIVKLASKNDPMYWRIIRTNEDGSIRLLYSGISTTSNNAVIDFSKYNNNMYDPLYAGYMYGTSGSLENNRTNTNDSTIKGVIDSWYNNNLSSYTKYISAEAVYCNDREVQSGQTYSTNSKFSYSSSARIEGNKTPTYNCTNNKDAFSGSNSEAKLSYPISLMTVDELSYIGQRVWRTIDANPNEKLWVFENVNRAGMGFWTNTPTYYKDYLFFWRLLWSNNDNSDMGWLTYGCMEDTYFGVRPVISIKTNAVYKSGNGSPESPYEIVLN